MADLQPPTLAPDMPARPADSVASPLHDDDLALGWECAAPVLQIERWSHEAAGEAD